MSNPKHRFRPGQVALKKTNQSTHAQTHLSALQPPI